MTIKERFEEKVKTVPSGCHEWQRCVNSKGYGKFGIGGGTQTAHRVSYEMYKGKIPKGMCVLHKCDNPLCVNPDHLFLGSLKDNARDMIKKGRAAHKEKHPSAKLNAMSVAVIRDAIAAGFRGKEIAAYFKVHFNTVSQIKIGTRWKQEEFQERYIAIEEMMSKGNTK